MSKRKRQIRQHKRNVAPGLQAKSVRVHKHDRLAKHGTKQSKYLKPEVSAAANPYTEAQHILCLGEGNFSFARAIVRLLEYCGGNVIATAFDSKETVFLKYEEGPDPVSDIVAELADCDATVLYDVDATNIHKSLQKSSKAQHCQTPGLFDTIVFNFPHVGLGIKDQDVNVRKNQQMLSSFFMSSCSVLKPDGEVHVTLKAGKPYSLWNIVSLAHHSTAGALSLKTTRLFQAANFPGYTHRRTLGYQEGVSHVGNGDIDSGSNTYIFRRSQQ